MTIAFDETTDPRERILTAAQEIKRRASSDSPPRKFFPEFLNLAMHALDADAGALWFASAERRQAFELRCERNLDRTELSGELRARHQNQQILAETLGAGQARMLVPQEAPASFPSRQHVLLAPLHDGARQVAVAQFFFASPLLPEAIAGYRQFVEQLCEWVSEYLRKQRADATPVSDEDLLQEFAAFVLRLQRADSLDAATTTVATEGRALLGCDRLTVVLKRGRKTQIEAVSGHCSANRRSALLRTMRRLAERCIESGEPLAFHGQCESPPPVFERALAEYIAESGARALSLIPLLENETETVGGKVPVKKKSRSRKPFGCLVIEQFQAETPLSHRQRRADLAADHMAAGLFSALERSRIPLRPLWRSLGRRRDWFRGRPFWIAAFVLLAVAGIGMGLAFIPWTYHVSSDGRLMPVAKRRVFAPQDGEVVQLFVTSGQKVHAGRPLLELRNDALRSQLIRVQVERDEKRQLANSLRHRIDAAVRQADRFQESELQGQRIELLAEIAGLAEQMRTLEQRIAELLVVAPIDGVVATFQIEELLSGRPVSRGESLLEVMDDAGAWQLELDVPERRMGHLLAGRLQAGQADLPVSYVLASAPEEQLVSHLKTVAVQAETTGENGAVVEIVAAIPSSKRPSHPRIGAEVRARIDCGQRSLGYVLFGDVIEFLRKWTWL